MGRLNLFWTVCRTAHRKPNHMWTCGTMASNKSGYTSTFWFKIPSIYDF